ncbi:tetraspanin-33-like isoform X2 [Bombina bombina]|uniref:tetraspanin-33-like isoform X2 n=1 Tax=Bombina bombina TaxID=8345 RepID=UPI00235A6A9E|nr:tetraspanin-33-like isoform X2 [Bombina bombina]
MRTNQIVKYSLFVSCYIFWVASGLMITVGIYAKLCKETSPVDSLTTDPAIMLIVVGILMFTITFIGCMGALRDLHLLLKIVLQKATTVMSRAIAQYREDLDLQNFIDYIQKKFECCGVNSYQDWSKNIYFLCTATNPSLEKCAVPYSCCIREKGLKIINTMCGYETQNLKTWDAEEYINTEGCLEKIVNWGRGNLLLLGGLAMGLILLEILVTCLAVIMIYQISFIMQRRKSTAPVMSEPKDRRIEYVIAEECEYVVNY